MAAGVLMLAIAPVAAAPNGEARERRLHVAAAEASSYLVNDWNRFQENYLPLYLGDDDPHTAWSLKTEGIGEWIRVHVTPMENATHVRMKIRNGYQKSEKLFAANSRARTLTVVLLPSNKSVDVDLTDSFGWQEIAVDQAAGPLNAVELRVKAVYPGTKYDDLCLSDVQLYVTATSSDNPVFEKQHFQNIVAWKQERAAAAKLFKSELGKAMPIAPQYVVTSSESPTGLPRTAVIADCADTPCGIEAMLGRALAHDGEKGPHAAAQRAARTLAHTKFAAFTATRVAAQDKRPIPRVDGLCTPSLDSCEADPCQDAAPLPLTGQLGYLRADGLALADQDGLPSLADVEAHKPRSCHSKAGGTYFWVARDPSSDGSAGKTRALLIGRCGLVEGREGSFPTHDVQLLVFGDDGRLEVIADARRAAALDWKPSDDGAKLARVSARNDNEEAVVVEAATAAVAAK